MLIHGQTTFADCLGRSGQPAGLAAVEAQMQAVANTAADTPAARAISHHLTAGGHRTRANFALDAGHALGLDPTVRVAIAASCELLHNASLLHDDLQDDCDVRRGRPTVAALFGRDVALCAGDLLISAAYAAAAPMVAHAGPRCLDLIHGAVSRAIDGQIRDRSGLNCSADWDTFERTAAAKSGALLALPFELCLLADAKAAALPTARSAGLAFGTAYQVVDDLADVEEDVRSGAVNAVLLLQAAEGLSRHAARAHAARLAASSLHQACDAAASLPQNAGAPLVTAAAALFNKLEEV